jgi:glycerol-3-phosphate cytidylyltransferase-like family protein
MQGPLKDRLREYQREKNDTDLGILNVQSEIRKAKNSMQESVQKGQANNMAYFDNLMRRQQETLARLQRKRKEMMDAEQRAKLMTLQAVSYVVQSTELDIPEDIIFKMMPKPAPVRGLLQRQEMRREIKQALKQDNGLVSTGRGSSVSRLPFEFRGDSGVQSSYAENVRMIGELVGKRSPRTLQTF